MRQVKYLAMLLIALFCSTTINAQGIKIYQKSGEVIDIPYNNIDSIIAFGDKNKDDKSVDLGLSVRWATCNVGATSPEEYGDYFAWGEIASKRSYSQNNSKTWEEELEEISGNPEYDAATAILGSDWRMPTKVECKELVDSCTWTWTTQNNIKGYKVTGPNGNSIFIPAAGSRSDMSLNNVNIQGGYWCSTPRNNDVFSADDIYINSDRYGIGSDLRFNGRSIRPVRK